LKPRKEIESISRADRVDRRTLGRSLVEKHSMLKALFCGREGLQEWRERRAAREKADPVKRKRAGVRTRQRAKTERQEETRGKHPV